MIKLEGVYDLKKDLHKNKETLENIKNAMIIYYTYFAG